MEIAKELVAELCLFRASSVWSSESLTILLTDMYETLLKTEKNIDAISGAFREEDQVYMEAYCACAGKEMPTEAPKFTVVKGGIGAEGSEDDDKTSS